MRYGCSCCGSVRGLDHAAGSGDWEKEHQAEELGLAAGVGLAEDLFEAEAGGFDGDVELLGGVAELKALEESISEAGFGGCEAIDLVHDGGA